MADEGTREKLSRLAATVKGASPKPDKIDNKATAALKEEEEVENLRSTREMRVEYANKVFKYLVAYSIAALGIIVLHGFKIFGFQLEAAPLTAIVGSTAASAIGLVGFVVSGLFRR